MTENSHHNSDKVSMEWHDLGIQLVVPSSLLDSIKATSGTLLKMFCCGSKLLPVFRSFKKKTGKSLLPQQIISNSVTTLKYVAQKCLNIGSKKSLERKF